MIILSALHNLSARPQVFPILGLIALLLVLLGYLCLYFSSKFEKTKYETPIWITIHSLAAIALGLSIYGIVAGIAGLALFVTTLAMVVMPYLAFGILVLFLWVAFRDGI